VTALPLVLAALIAQSPGADTLLRLASTQSGPSLVVEARARPGEVRDGVSEAMRRAVSTPESAPQILGAARRIALAYAEAWRDSFYVRQVDQFRGWSPQRRAVKVRADSLRRAGNAAYAREGPQAAIAVWHLSRRSSLAIGDSAGSAAVLGNLGAAFLAEQMLDSAFAHLERARELAAAVGDARVEANAVGLLAGVYEERGELESARRAYARAVALRGRTGDRRGLAADHNNLGLLARRLGDQQEARSHFETALEINRQDGRDEPAATNLVNLADLASLEGRFASAEAQYRDALATWRAVEAWPDVASVFHALGLLELRRGDYPAARRYLEEALVIYGRTGPVVDAIAVERSLAAALGAAGDPQGALDALRRAGRRADSAPVPAGVLAGLALARADVSLQLNDFSAARREFGQAESQYRSGGDLAGQAEAQSGLGLALVEEGDVAKGEAMLAAALRTQESMGRGRSAALTRLLLGHAASERDDRREAQRQLALAAREFWRLGDPVGSAAALQGLGRLAEANDPAAADSLYRAGLARLQGRTAPGVAWRLHAGLGRVAAARGQSTEASREFRAAIEELEGPALSFGTPERRSSYLEDKWNVYGDLAMLERGRGRPATAFEVSERMRARMLLELVGQGRIASTRDSAMMLLAEAQDLRRQIAEIALRQDASPAGGSALRGPVASPATARDREVLERAQGAYAELLLEMEERAPAGASLLAGTTASWRAVSRRLGAGEVLIEYLVADSNAVAFVLTRDSLGTVPLGIGRRELSSLVELARGTLQRQAGLGQDSLWRSPLRRLHSRLITPIEESGLLSGASRLVIVPHGELYYLPFAAFLDPAGRGYLVQRYELLETPSATLWLALGERRAGLATAGVLAVAPRPDVLPGSAGEVRAVSRLAGTGTTVLSGSAATESAFRREAPNYRVVHLASSGVLNKTNPLFSYVDLRPDGEHDGRLDVHEVFGLGLTADLVVLSACQTGLAAGRFTDVPAGDDWVGLTQAFLQAGAGSVVATLWAIEDQATAVLMERFYEQVTEGATPASALAAAQRAMLRSASTAHPFYWSGFVAVGGAR